MSSDLPYTARRLSTTGGTEVTFAKHVLQVRYGANVGEDRTSAASVKLHYFELCGPSVTVLGDRHLDTHAHQDCICV